MVKDLRVDMRFFHIVFTPYSSSRTSSEGIWTLLALTPVPPSKKRGDWSPRGTYFRGVYHQTSTGVADRRSETAPQNVCVLPRPGEGNEPDTFGSDTVYV